MGILYEYFAAADQDTAAAVLDGEPAGGPQSAGRDSLGAVKGIEPAVQLGTLEALLHGIDFDLIYTTPWHCDLIAQSSPEGPFVVTVADTLRDALAKADESRLSEIAVPWSRTAEFGDSAPEATALLTDFLGSFAELARTAVSRGESLYCWICV